MLGSAIFNSKSQIVARRFSRQRQGLDADFFLRRIRQAMEYRARRQVNPKLCRLVWSESDGLPGVIVDRYGEHLVLQTLTLAMDRHKSLIVDALRTVAGVTDPGHNITIIERNDAPIRKAEGMELRTGVLFGETTMVRIEILGLHFQIDLLHGQKTGFYLDQLANYADVGKWASGRRVLDCFANQGAFALACAQAGATGVTAVEISADCTRLLRDNAARNHLAVECVEANVFDYLKNAERDGVQFDFIILDPPSFTKTKGALGDAMRGYKEIHLRALKLLNPDGLLATFCCSHHVGDTDFHGMICEALVDAKKTARQLQRYQQGLDHPVLPTLPETEYLKGYLLEMAPGR